MNIDDLWVAEYSQKDDQFNVTTMRDSLKSTNENFIKNHPLWTIVYCSDDIKKVNKQIEKLRKIDKA